MNYKILAFVMCGGENISARSFTCVRVYNTAYLDSIKSSTTTDNSSNVISIKDNGSTTASCWIISRTKIKMRSGGTTTTSCLIRLYGI